MAFRPLATTSPHPADARSSPTLSFNSSNSRASSPANTRSPALSTATPPAPPAPPAPAVANQVGLGLGVPSAQQDEGKTAEVTSPLELTEFVDNLLNDLEARFDAMSTDVLSRLSSLSTRVDSLESSISDLMSGTAGGPVFGDEQAAGPEKGGLLVRSASGRVLGGK